MDIQMILALLAIIGAYQLGRWTQRADDKSRRAGEAAAAFADQYDRASQVNRPR